MPNRCKPESEKRNKGLLLSLRKKEYDIIDTLSKHLGLSKTDLILTAIRKQYSRSEIGKDYLNDYIVMLKRQIDVYEVRIKEEQRTLKELKEEYELMVSLRTGENKDEETQRIQSEREDDNVD